MGGGFGQAANEGGEGCSWFMWPGWCDEGFCGDLFNHGFYLYFVSTVFSTNDLTKCFQDIRYSTMDQTPLLQNPPQPVLLDDDQLHLNQDSSPFSSLLFTAWPSLAENCSCCAEVEGGAQQGGA